MVSNIPGEESRTNNVLTLDAVKEMKKVNDIDFLIRALLDRSPITRQEAAIVLGEVDVSEAHRDMVVSMLIKCLGDEDVNVKTSAIWSLGKISDRRAIGPLELIVRENDSFRLLRESALQALNQIRFSNMAELRKEVRVLVRDVTRFFGGKRGNVIRGDPDSYDRPADSEDREAFNGRAGEGDTGRSGVVVAGTTEDFERIQERTDDLGRKAREMGETEVEREISGILGDLMNLRSLIIVQGDLIQGGKTEIKDSVMNRTNLDK